MSNIDLYLFATLNTSALKSRIVLYDFAFLKDTDDTLKSFNSNSVTLMSHDFVMSFIRNGSPTFSQFELE